MLTVQLPTSHGEGDMSRSRSVRSYRLGMTEAAVALDALKEDSRALFLRCRQGILLCFDGVPGEQIRSVS